MTVLGAVLVGSAVYKVMDDLQDSTPDDVHYSMYIDTETGKTFRHKNETGETHPIESPYSGKRTGVVAEPCFWTADGGTKSEPTWVLLNELAGKQGPTFCPDCGRLVVGHNPQPGEGVRPAPTKEEYAARKADRAAVTAAAKRDARSDER